MKSYFIANKDWEAFVIQLLQITKVIGPVAQKTKFVFEALKSYQDLRLDYDVTILPAKKAFFPTRQTLVKFDGNNVESCIHPVEQVLLGVHFYEIKAIDMLDELFRSGYEDRNYLANREHTTIVGSNIQQVSPRAFWASVSTDRKPKGHDAFLTKLAQGYVYESLTDKGEKLVACGKFTVATKEQLAEAVRINEEVMTKCQEKLKYSAKEIGEKVRNAFKNKNVWEDLAKDCFSCGTCNIVCPTCYCFDVQDTWNLDQVSGVRTRCWDGCLLEDFSTVSLGGGSIHNFRTQRAERYRHRAMRKTAYLNEKLNSPACVGCGRCSANCVPDIADPVHIIDKIMEG